MLRRKWSFSTMWTISFIIMLGVASAAALALLVCVLKEKKIEARELDRSQQLLISAKIFSPDGYFLMPKDGTYIPAKLDSAGVLVPGTVDDKASPHQVATLYHKIVRALVVDRSGVLSTYEKAGLEMGPYLSEWRVTKPGLLAWLPIFEILAVDGSGAPVSYVIPITGFGLWDRIVGYIAIRPDGKTVEGIAWYDQKETPGLGGVITESGWQAQFQGKIIFQPDEKGQVDMERSPIGIRVVKGTVSDVLDNSPKAMNAVDGIAGATLTGKGVTAAYKDNLELYRPFFEKLAEMNHGEAGRMELLLRPGVQKQ